MIFRDGRRLRKLHGLEADELGVGQIVAARACRGQDRKLLCHSEMIGNHALQKKAGGQR